MVNKIVLFPRASFKTTETEPNSVIPKDISAKKLGVIWRIGI